MEYKVKLEPDRSDPYGYIFITTNLQNGMRFVGAHKADHFIPQHLGDNGVLKKAIALEGKQNFKCEPIEWCSSKQELRLREFHWINKLRAILNKTWYNAAKDYTPIRRSTVEQEAKKKIVIQPKYRKPIKEEHPLPQCLQKSYKRMLTSTEIWLVDTETGEILERTPRTDAKDQLQQILQRYIDQLDENTYNVLQYMICRVDSNSHTTLYHTSTPEDSGISWKEVQQCVSKLKNYGVIRPTKYENVYEMVNLAHEPVINLQAN